MARRTADDMWAVGDRRSERPAAERRPGAERRRPADPSRVPNEARRGGPRPSRNGPGGQRPNPARPPSNLPPAGDPPGPLYPIDGQLNPLAPDTTAPFAAGWRPPSALADEPGLHGDGLAPLGAPEDPFSFGPARADDVSALTGDLDDFDGYGADSFGATSYFSQEPTPALLAAKAEPLGDVPPRRPRRVSRPAGAPGPSGPTKGRGPAKAQGRSQGKGKPRPQQQVRKEPSKALLAIGIAAVILVGVGAGWYFTRSKTTATDQATTSATTAGGAKAATGGQTQASANPAATSASVKPAVTGTLDVLFDDAARGPITAGKQYQIGVTGAPVGATAYQILVDTKPLAEPAPALGPATFTEGRHLLAITLTDPAGKALATNQVVVYATPAQVTRSYRANLASVSTTQAPAGSTAWAEAVKAYDQYLAAGHAKLKLMPSDGFASLKPGFWNLFVDGFPDAAAATAYCKQFNLEVPGQCFPKLFDPNAPAGG